MSKNTQRDLLGDGMPERVECFDGELGILRYSRDELDTLMKPVVEQCEDKYGIRFQKVDYYSRDLLNWLLNSPSYLSASILPADKVTNQRSTLAAIGNIDDPNRSQQSEYFESLLSIYRMFGLGPGRDLENRDVLFLGIEREGRILAKSLGWLPDGHSATPHAKRIPYYRGSLLVGVTNLPSVHTFSSVVIVDGAIATGATLVSIMSQLNISMLQLYSVHASLQALRTLERFRKHLSKKSTSASLELHVGYTTDGLSSDFYATEEVCGEIREVVGDLGDRISPLFIRKG